jgi:hypothetical protein
MLNETRLKVLVNAYSVRLGKGESLESIDESLRNIKRVNESDIKKIHDKLNIK